MFYTAAGGDKLNVKGVWSGNEVGWSENKTSDPLGTLLASTKVKVQWSQVNIHTGRDA